MDLTFLVPPAEGQFPSRKSALAKAFQRLMDLTFLLPPAEGQFPSRRQKQEALQQLQTVKCKDLFYVILTAEQSEILNRQLMLTIL